MTKDKLIAKQQRKIEKMKKQLAVNQHVLQDIQLSFICIGGPLNDNRLQFNSAQIAWLSAIHGKIEEIL